MMDGKPSKGRGIVNVAVLASVAWLAFLYWATTGWSSFQFLRRVEELHSLSLNEIGDFLAGTLSAFAIIGLLTTIVLQRRDLEQANHQFNAAQKQATAAQEANYKLQLFEARFDVAQKFGEAVFHIRSDGNVSIEARVKLAAALERSPFLFGEDFNSAIKEVSEKANHWRRLDSRVTSIRSRSTKTPEQEKDAQAKLREMEEIDRWLYDEMNNKKYETMFAKYLKMPEPTVVAGS